jgi:hypothetical protein
MTVKKNPAGSCGQKMPQACQGGHALVDQRLGALNLADIRSTIPPVADPCFTDRRN